MPGCLRQRCPAARIEDLSPVLVEMRLVKDEQEISVLREAGATCADALAACMRATAPGVMEYQLAGVLEYHYRISGARGASYHPIIAGGTNAWYGHYNANDALLNDGDLVLLDCAPTCTILHLRHHPHVASERHPTATPSAPCTAS